MPKVDWFQAPISVFLPFHCRLSSSSPFCYPHSDVIGNNFSPISGIPILRFSTYYCLGHVGNHDKWKERDIKDLGSHVGHHFFFSLIYFLLFIFHLLLFILVEQDGEKMWNGVTGTQRVRWYVWTNLEPWREFEWRHWCCSVKWECEDGVCRLGWVWVTQGAVMDGSYLMKQTEWWRCVCYSNGSEVLCCACDWWVLASSNKLKLST